MMKLNLPSRRGSPLNILCLGSHSDDIEIGCGGTILELIDRYPECVFHWVVFSAIGVRKAEAQRGVDSFVGSKHQGQSIFKEFPDTYMPYLGSDVKNFFHELKETISPDLIFTHNRNDAHQDHRLISELTWNAFRDHLILEYEIPKYDGDLGQPSVFLPLKSDVCKKKISYIMDVFQSQHTKRWFEENTFLSLMRLRGMECNAPSGHAEAFYCRKIVL